MTINLKMQKEKKKQNTKGQKEKATKSEKLLFPPR